MVIMNNAILIHYMYVGLYQFDCLEAILIGLKFTISWFLLRDFKAIHDLFSLWVVCKRAGHNRDIPKRQLLPSGKTFNHYNDPVDKSRSTTGEQSGLPYLEL